MALKIDVLFDALSEQLSDQMKRTSSIPSVPLVLVLLACTLSSVTAAAALLLREVLRDLQQPKLRYAGTRVLVSIPPQPGRTHHVFISHVWETAQDQARVLRQRLQAVVPGLRVWLGAPFLVLVSCKVLRY